MANILKKLKDLKWWHYVLLALAVHTIPLLIWGGLVMYPVVTDVLQFKGTYLAKQSEMPSRPEKPVEKQKTEQKTVVKTDVPVHITQPQKEKRIVAKPEARAPQEFVRPPDAVQPKKVDLSELGKVEKPIQPVENLISKGQAERRVAYANYKKRFAVKGLGRTLEAQFTPYQGSFSGGAVDPRSVPNLMTEVGKRTNVKAETKPVIAALEDYERIKKFPYIYLTGHDDFHLTDKEVKNLRNYLIQGGLVWADNGLAGRRSKFDIAFRREMKRVMPDRDFEVLPMDHTIYKSPFYQFTDVPSGMNWRDEPIEVMKIDRRVAVIYTLNDYGDLWDTAHDKDGNVDHSLDENWAYRHGQFWDYIEYENVTQESVENAYRLGINIVAFILTRE
jgi:hypothetical protein